MAGQNPISQGAKEVFGELDVRNISGAVSLPTGAATVAKQDTGNTSLSSVDGKLPALVAGRIPTDGSGVTQPVSGPLTDAQLRLVAVPISGTVTASGPLTDAQLRAATVPISGTVTASGPVTDAQLRATPVAISGTVTATDGAGSLTVDTPQLPAALVSGRLDINVGNTPALGAATARVGGTYDCIGQVIDEVPTVRTVSRSFANATLIGNNEVVATQGASIRIRVLSVLAVATLGVTVKFQSATTDITAGFPLGNNGGVVLPYNQHGWFQTAANEALNINLSLATATGVQLTWVQAA